MSIIEHNSATRWQTRGADHWANPGHAFKKPQGDSPLT